MKFFIEYELHEAGWATVHVQSDKKKTEHTVSYLHDSLKELAQAAISLKSGSKEENVVFMDEPGETHFFLRRNEEELNLEIRWFDDWASWNMHPKSKFKVVESMTIPVSRFIQQVHTVLHKINDSIGPEKYKKLWVEHDFPINEYETLQGHNQSLLDNA